MTRSLFAMTLVMTGQGVIQEEWGVDADRNRKVNCDPSPWGQGRERKLLARVPGRPAYLLGEMGNRRREASLGEEEGAGLKHLEPEGQKARGWWPQGRESRAAIRDVGVTAMDRSRPKGQEMVQIAWGMPRKEERSGLPQRSPAF